MPASPRLMDNSLTQGGIRETAARQACGVRPGSPYSGRERGSSHAAPHYTQGQGVRHEQGQNR